MGTNECTRAGGATTVPARGRRSWRCRAADSPVHSDIRQYSRGRTLPMTLELSAPIHWAWEWADIGRLKRKQISRVELNRRSALALDAQNNRVTVPTRSDAMKKSRVFRLCHHDRESIAFEERLFAAVRGGDRLRQHDGRPRLRVRTVRSRRLLNDQKTA